MRLNAATKQYIEEYQERINSIPDGAQQLADHISYGVGRAYFTIGLEIYIANHTGSDVPEWAVQYYSFADCEDASPTNEEIIAMLAERAPQRAQPVMTRCDCGHYSESPMSASLGTSCPDCYDRMSD